MKIDKGQIKGYSDSSIIIPKPDIQIIGHGLYYRFYYDNNFFLNYSPEIWLFRYSKVGFDKTKGYKHPVHYSNTPRTNVEFSQRATEIENLYEFSGNTQITELKRSTEWALANQARWTLIPINIPDFFVIRILTLSTNYYIPSTVFNPANYNNLVPTEFEVRAIGGGKTTQYFRFAIVINNPDSSSWKEKLVGEMSDVVGVRYIHFLNDLNQTIYKPCFTILNKNFKP